MDLKPWFQRLFPSLGISCRPWPVSLCSSLPTLFRAFMGAYDRHPTKKEDIDLIKQRLKQAQELYKQEYGK